MENNIDKKNTDEDVKNTLITIISVLVYIVYELAKDFIGVVKRLAEKGIINCIITIIGVFILIMIALIFLPYMGVAITGILFLFVLNSLSF